MKTRILQLLGVSILSVVVLVTISKTTTPTRKSSSVAMDTVTPRDDMLLDSIARVTSANGTVLLALVDTGFIEMAVNFYETSLKRFAIRNFLFVGASADSCLALADRNLACHTYAEDVDAGRPSLYGSEQFIRKMNIRTDMILAALHGGYTVVHSDLDVVFLQNPISDMDAVEGDIAALYDDTAFNAGFLVVRPSAGGKWIYGRMRTITRESKSTDDQTALNTALTECTAHSPPCRVAALPTNQYLCGVCYFERGHRMFADQSPCEECKVVHNNWIVSMEAKVYRMKETHLWRNDAQNYYSSNTTKYITYNTPTYFDSQNRTLWEETDALKNALALGQVLARVVILPRFHCPGDEREARCPLNSWYSVRAFDAEFPLNYRESSFLSHPLVPDTVKRSVWRCGPFMSDPSFMTRLLYDTSSVIEFDHLYGRNLTQTLQLGETISWEQKVMKAFVSSDYRQF